MMERGRSSRRLIAAVLVGLAGCAGPDTSQRAEEGLAGPLALTQAVEGLPAALASLQSNQASGRFGEIRGIGALQAPIVLPLADAEVSVIPATPGLEAFLRQVRQRWLAQERRPFQEAEFRAVASLLDRYVQTLKLLGGSPFVRFTKADKNATFRFEQLPAGRWVLATELASSASALFWAVSGEVREGATSPVFLGNDNLLMEWVRAQPKQEKEKDGHPPTDHRHD